MKIKGIIDCDLVNYKYPSLLIAAPYCDFKCDKLNGECLCQNSHLAHAPLISIPAAELIEKYYVTNPLTKAFVFQGLEPFDSFYDLLTFIQTVRKDYKLEDDIVIYTGYTEEEIGELVSQLKPYKNIVIKYGRYVPNQSPHYDTVLEVPLASDNQYAVRY